ncbi:hypothetical protein GNI_116460 [Gregarina niphandrodes]|uniref:Uncharacterized protein n=1 Tax=Gregarina niphandrodes TaxID=110365 RepID=A0A023B2T8_GRENI|nr:hypothetical protein GNI_116460 [Gregarina niphandrodes]EZG55206.1 hypothetical protein GNI_116460 [Gregarina niphandrodes]|eukprot:XP_011131733.1 hypothetical protein GNI_116460 [Gregarina niphandrodes]
MRHISWIFAFGLAQADEPNIIRFPDIAGLIHNWQSARQNAPRRTIAQMLFGFAGNPEPITSDSAASDYSVNDRGQFLDVDSFANAITDQLGVPLALSTRLAELNHNFGKQLLLVNAAIGDWLSEIEQQLPIGYISSGEMVDAVGSGDRGVVPLVFPAIGGIIENMVNVMTAPFRAPRSELDSVNELVRFLSPVVLT